MLPTPDNRKTDGHEIVAKPRPLVSVVIPTLNEANNVVPMIERADRAVRRVLSNFEILVVDDSSTDGTADLAEEKARTLSHVRVMRRTGAPDLSRSVLDGWAAATGDVLCVIDSDLQHPPEKLADLISAILTTDADIAVASRNVTGGGVSQWALHRRAISWCATLMATVLVPGILRMVRDPMSGFFAIRRRVLDSADLQPTGYKILLEVLARADYDSVVEIPYVFEERKQGASKLGRKQVWQYLRHVLHLSERTGEIRLFPKFAAVGASGVLVNGILSHGWQAAASSTSLAWLAFGFECSVISNFVLNEMWTFKGKTEHLHPVQPVAQRLGSFQLVAFIGLAVNLATFALLSIAMGTPQWLAMLAAVATGGLTNFVAATNLTWSLWSEEDEELPAGVMKRHRRVAAGRSTEVQPTLSKTL